VALAEGPGEAQELEGGEGEGEARSANGQGRARLDVKAVARWAPVGQALVPCRAPVAGPPPIWGALTLPSPRGRGGALQPRSPKGSVAQPSTLNPQPVRGRQQAGSLPVREVGPDQVRVGGRTAEARGGEDAGGAGAVEDGHAVASVQQRDVAPAGRRR